MDKKARFTILTICVVLFLVITPYLVMYSMGYRINFETLKITETGGIYVKSYPQADEITIDSKITEKPGLFSNYVFVQDLIPKDHTVLVKKTGYFDYAKNLEVEEKEVTKIENIILFKTDTVFGKLLSDVMSFSISPDKKNVLVEGTNTKSLDFYYFPISSPNTPKQYTLPLKYTSVLNIEWSDDSNKALIKTQNSTGVIDFYLLDFTAKIQLTVPLSYLDSKSTEISFNPQDSSQIFYIEKNNLYSVKNNKSSLIIKGLSTYKITDNNILWISTEGLMTRSDTSGKLVDELITKESPLPTDKAYTIETISGKIFLTSNNSLYLYDFTTKTLESFKNKISDYKLLQSPDGKNMVYYNGSDIYLYAFERSEYNKTGENNIKLFSANSGETISNCFWLNNDYIIFESGNRIIISEIDYRGNINAVEIPKNYEASADSKSPSVFFNSQDSKLYLLSGNVLYSTEKLLP